MMRHDVLIRLLACAVSILLTVIALAPASAQPATEREIVDLRPKWKVGESITLEFLYLIDVKNPLTGEALPHMARQVQMRVLEATEDGYVLGWKYVRVLVDNVETPDGDPMTRMMAGLEVEVVLNREGTMLGIRNKEALLRKLDESNAANDRETPTTKKREDQPMTDPAEAEAKANLDKALEYTRKFAQQMRQVPGAELGFIAEGLRYFPGLGWQIEVGVEKLASRDTPHPMGELPVRCETLTSLVRHDDHTATISIKAEYDQKMLEAAVRDAIERTQKKAGIDAPVGEIRMEMSEESEFMVHRASGWSTEGWYKKRTVQNGKAKLVEIRWRKIEGK